MTRTATTICGGNVLPGCIFAGILINVLVLGVSPVLVHAQPARETIVQTVDRLEKAAGINGNPAMPLPERIEAVEQKTLGAAQYGALVERIERLRRTLLPQTVEPAAAVPAIEHPSLDETVSAAFAPAFLSDSLPLLNAIPPNFLRIEPPAKAVDENADYLSEVIDAGKNKVFHFKAMPIPVIINSFPDRNFTTSVLRGFETWENRTDGTVRFVQVDDVVKARIQVVWKRLGKDQDDSGCIIGAHTITKYTEHGKGNLALFTVGGVPVPMYIPKFGPRYSVPPQIIEVNLDLIMSKNPTIRYRLLQNVVTHELGHALGLLGHSKNADDMMYAVTDEHSRLSDRDVNTLHKLYDRKPDVAL